MLSRQLPLPWFLAGVCFEVGFYTSASICDCMRYITFISRSYINIVLRVSYEYRFLAQSRRNILSAEGPFQHPSERMPHHRLQGLQVRGMTHTSDYCLGSSRSRALSLQTAALSEANLNAHLCAVGARATNITELCCHARFALHRDPQALHNASPGPTSRASPQRRRSSYNRGLLAWQRCLILFPHL